MEGMSVFKGSQLRLVAVSKDVKIVFRFLL